MERPVMNPSVLLELEKPAPRPRRLARFRKILPAVGKVLLFEPMGFLRRQRRVEIGSPLSRILRGVLYRVLGIPVMVVAVATVMVFNGTHPGATTVVSDPQSLGVYHDPVTFLAEDGTRLEAWLVPVIDAKRVIAEREEALRKKRPAVILVHDYGATREQMLPLIRPLHDAGFVVMVVGLRGSDSRVPAGQTFGLNESGDVLAAVDVLRRRPAVDPNRIALIGVGTGATASLIAAQKDSGVAALVLDNPLRHSDEIMSRIAPAQWWLAWMRPTCKWTFDLAYGVDADDVDLRRLQPVMKQRPCLMLDNGSAGTAGLRGYAVQQVLGFLKSHVTPPPPVPSPDPAVATTPQE